MARPRGQYDVQKESCYQLLKRLNPCFATNAFLGTQLGGRSTKQVQRYLNSLQTEGRILITTKKHYNPDGTVGAQRTIKITVL